MADVWVVKDNQGHWNPCSRTLLRLESRDSGSFYRVHSFHGSPREGVDRMVWSGVEDHLSLKSYYNLLYTARAKVFLTNEVWGFSAPLGACFFVWEATRKKIITIDYLMKREQVVCQ